MVKRKKASPSCSDEEVTEEGTRTDAMGPRGQYKTYKRVRCKTEEEKKASKAAAQKKWRMAKKTDRAKELAEAKKEEFSAMNTTKTKASKR